MASGLLDEIGVRVDDERAVTDAAVMLPAVLAGRLGIERPRVAAEAFPAEIVLRAIAVD